MKIPSESRLIYWKFLDYIDGSEYNYRNFNFNENHVLIESYQFDHAGSNGTTLVAWKWIFIKLLTKEQVSYVETWTKSQNTTIV